MLVFKHIFTFLIRDLKKRPQVLWLLHHPLLGDIAMHLSVLGHSLPLSFITGEEKELS